MKLLGNNNLLYVIGIIAGVFCLTMGVVVNNADLNIPGGILNGIGAGLFSYSLSTLINHRIETRHPELKRRKYIEVNDERNVIIKDKAGARTHLFSLYAICIVAFIFTLLKVEVYVMITLMGLLFLNTALYGVYVIYYNRKL